MARHSRYYTQALRNPDRRYERILAKLGHGPAPETRAKAREAPPVVAPQAEAPDTDERPALRTEYQALTGKRAFTGWSAEELRARIASAQG